jgi:hypothetical protein
MEKTDYLDLWAFLNAQRGQYDTFTARCPSGISPRGSWGGTPLVNGAAAAGVASVAIDGLTPSVAGTGKRGDWIKFNGHSKVYQLTRRRRRQRLRPGDAEPHAGARRGAGGQRADRLLLGAVHADPRLRRAASSRCSRRRWARSPSTPSRTTDEPRRERAVQAEWAKSQNAPCHLVELQFDAADGGTVYITDSYRTITTTATATSRSARCSTSPASRSRSSCASPTPCSRCRASTRPTSRRSCSGSTCTGAWWSTRRSSARRRAGGRPVRDPRRAHGRAEVRRGPGQRQVRGERALARPVRRLRAHHRAAHQPERPGAVVPERPRLRPDRAARRAAAEVHLGPLAAAGPSIPRHVVPGRAPVATATSDWNDALPGRAVRALARRGGARSSASTGSSSAGTRSWSRSRSTSSAGWRASALGSSAPSPRARSGASTAMRSTHRAEPELQGPRVRLLPRDLHRAARAPG